MLRAAPLLALAAALATSGCVAQASPGHGLTGSEWRFLSIDGEAPVSDRAALSFEKERIGANVGCNGMGGPWRIEGGRLVAGPLAQTQMYCEGPVWPQEQATSALLVAAPEVSLSGDRMVLRSRGHFAELERVNPPRQGR
mgnify:FL=1